MGDESVNGLFSTASFDILFEFFRAHVSPYEPTRNPLRSVTIYVRHNTISVKSSQNLNATRIYIYLLEVHPSVNVNVLHRFIHFTEFLTQEMLSLIALFIL